MKDDMKKQFNDAFDDVQSLVPWGPDEPSPTRAIGAQDFIKEIGNKKPKIEADKKEQRTPLKLEFLKLR